MYYPVNKLPLSSQLDTIISHDSYQLSHQQQSSSVISDSTKTNTHWRFLEVIFHPLTLIHLSLFLSTLTMSIIMHHRQQHISYGTLYQHHQLTTSSRRLFFPPFSWYPHHFFPTHFGRKWTVILLWKTDNTISLQLISRPSDSGTCWHITPCLSAFNASNRRTDCNQRSFQLDQYRSAPTRTQFPSEILPQLRSC